MKVMSKTLTCCLNDLDTGSCPQEFSVILADELDPEFEDGTVLAIGVNETDAALFKVGREYTFIPGQLILEDGTVFEIPEYLRAA